MTLRSADLLRRYGDPRAEKNLSLWYCPPDLLAQNPLLPKKVYANLDIHGPLTRALYKCAERGVLGEITTWDGCFMIRNIRGSGEMSTHAWAVAVDMNAKHNPLGMTRAQCRASGLKPFSERFVQCWKDTGWEWGGDWQRADGQHFQLAKLP